MCAEKACDASRRYWTRVLNCTARHRHRMCCYRLLINNASSVLYVVTLCAHHIAKRVNSSGQDRTSKGNRIYIYIYYIASWVGGLWGGDVLCVLKSCVESWVWHAFGRRVQRGGKFTANGTGRQLVRRISKVGRMVDWCWVGIWCLFYLGMAFLSIAFNPKVFDILQKIQILRVKIVNLNSCKVNLNIRVFTLENTSAFKIKTSTLFPPHSGMRFNQWRRATTRCS